MRFCDIPGIHGCLHRHVRFRVVNDMPILDVHGRPLKGVRGELVGHVFSMVFSLLFLYALFPVVFLVMKIAVGVASSNPVFFHRGHGKLGGGRF